MRAGARLFLLVLSCLLLLATTPDIEQPLNGYSAASSRVERDWEAKFRAIPEPQNQRDYMQRLSARPHHVGSPYDKDNAEWMLAKFKEWGLDANIESFDVLFPTPKARIVELIEPTKFTAKLQEPALAVDPYTFVGHCELLSLHIQKTKDPIQRLSISNIGFPRSGSLLDSGSEI